MNLAACATDATRGWSQLAASSIQNEQAQSTTQSHRNEAINTYCTPDVGLTATAADPRKRRLRKASLHTRKWGDRFKHRLSYTYYIALASLLSPSSLFHWWKKQFHVIFPHWLVVKVDVCMSLPSVLSYIRPASSHLVLSQSLPAVPASCLSHRLALSVTDLLPPSPTFVGDPWNSQVTGDLISSAEMVWLKPESIWIVIASHYTPPYGSIYRKRSADPRWPRLTTIHHHCSLAEPTAASLLIWARAAADPESFGRLVSMAKYDSTAFLIVVRVSDHVLVKYLLLETVVHRGVKL